MYMKKNDQNQKIIQTLGRKVISTVKEKVVGFKKDFKIDFLDFHSGKCNVNSTLESTVPNTPNQEPQSQQEKVD